MKNLILVMLVVGFKSVAFATPWFVDAQIKSSDDRLNLGTSNVTSWTQLPGASDLTLTNNGSSNATLNSLEPAISFTPTEATFYESCVRGSFETGVGGGTYGGHVIISLQIVETGYSNHTPVSTSGPVAEFAPARVALGDNKMYNEAHVSVCRTFEFSANVQRTLRLFYKQKVSQTVLFSEGLLGGTWDNDADNSLHWTVRPIR